MRWHQSGRLVQILFDVPNIVRDSVAIVSPTTGRDNAASELTVSFSARVLPPLPLAPLPLPGAEAAEGAAPRAEAVAASAAASSAAAAAAAAAAEAEAAADAEAGPEASGELEHFSVDLPLFGAVQLPAPFGVNDEELAALEQRAARQPPPAPESRWALADDVLLVVLAKQSDRMRYAFGGAMALGGGTSWPALVHSAVLSEEQAARAAAEEADAKRRQEERVASLARKQEEDAAAAAAAGLDPAIAEAAAAAAAAAEAATAAAEAEAGAGAGAEAPGAEAPGAEASASAATAPVVAEEAGQPTNAAWAPASAPWAAPAAASSGARLH